MKKVTLLVASLVMLFSLKTNAQNERILLFECFTNTSCGPCAQQNPALDALINANADRVAAIKYHMNWPGANDPMYLHNTTDNNSRKGVYSVNSVPHTVVDGIRFANTPGNLNQNMVNQWLSIESPIEMRLAYELDEPNNLITVHVMGRASAELLGNIRLYVGVIEKEIHYSSAPGTNGEKDFYSVMKKLLPTASGTSLGDLAVGDYFTYTFTWELANVYNNDQLDAIAWVQNAGTKEVYQACKSSENIEPFYANEACLRNISNAKSVSCSGWMEPKVELANYGSNTLTSAELGIVVNGESLKSVEWSGNLATLASEVVDLGEISFPVEEGTNSLEVIVLSVNGTNDEAPANDIAEFEITGAPENVAKVLKLTVRTDDNPQETTWKVTNMATGQVVIEGGPYDEANHKYETVLEITGDGCYDFTIYDAGGNGLSGTGVYGLKAGSATLFSGREFGFSESNEFSYEVTADVDENFGTGTSIYPNPTTGLMNIVGEGVQNVTIYNMAGQRVFEGQCDGWLQIDMKRFGAGVYAVQVGEETQRIVVK